MGNILRLFFVFWKLLSKSTWLKNLREHVPPHFEWAWHLCLYIHLVDSLRDFSTLGLAHFSAFQHNWVLDCFAIWCSELYTDWVFLDLLCSFCPGLKRISVLCHSFNIYKSLTVKSNPIVNCVTQPRNSPTSFSIVPPSCGMDRSKFAGSNDMMSMTAVMIWYSVTITEEDDTEVQGLFQKECQKNKLCKQIK